MYSYKGSNCGENFDGASGTFQSPGYPRKYPKRAFCVWRIQTPVGTRVQLNVGWHQYKVTIPFLFSDLFLWTDNRASTRSSPAHFDYHRLNRQCLIICFVCSCQLDLCKFGDLTPDHSALQLLHSSQICLQDVTSIKVYFFPPTMHDVLSTMQRCNKIYYYLCLYIERSVSF